MDEENMFRLSSYLHRSSGYRAKSNAEENENDHIYPRSPFFRPDAIFAKPQRTLFVHPSDNESIGTEDEDVDIDVESTTPALAPLYDVNKANNAMEECERHVNFHHPDEGNPDWEENIPRINWSNLQTRIFSRVVRLLNSDKLARAAHSGNPKEALLRRTTVDKTARRLRQTLAIVEWDAKFTQWLHTTLMDNLPASFLVSYLDALQTLKSKVPTLVDRMLAAPNNRSMPTPSQELLNIVQKKPWDPLTGGIINYKPRKLPKDPILVMVPSAPGAGNTSNSRSHHWMANLSPLATVVCVYSPPGKLAGKISVANCLDHMLATTRAKVTELHQDYADKPIILVGIGSGASLALQVALVEKVAAVVCLGFPMLTVEDNRGTPDDALLNIQVPVLFVIGQDASTCFVDDLEELREKLNVVTSLVVVGGADDQLRLTKAKKKLEGVTQVMVDKCIVDEVADFLGTLLSPDYVPPTRPIIVHPIEPPPKRNVVRTIERKRKNDSMTPASPDNIGPVPAKKGRKPKISMMQKMVQNKWAGQLPLSQNESQRPNIVPPPSSQSPMTLSQGKKPVLVMDRKNLQQINIQQQKTSKANVGEGTITVVAASSPTLSQSTPVKGRIASGKLTSLSTLLQPGTRGVISPSSRTVAKDDRELITISGLSQESSLSQRINLSQRLSLSQDSGLSQRKTGPKEISLSQGSSLSSLSQGMTLNSLSQEISMNHQPLLEDELNILDMPVVLEDQSTDILPSTSTTPIAPKPPVPTSSHGPIRLLLTNKSTTRPAVKCTKIFIGKPPTTGSTSKTLYIGDINNPSRAKPKIRNFPATRNSQFY